MIRMNQSVPRKTVPSCLRIVWVLWMGFFAVHASAADFDQGIIQQVREATVRVIYETQEETGRGSGFVISKQGHIATNQHVVNGSGEITILLTIGNTLYAYEGTLIAACPDRDLAIIQCGINRKATPLTLFSGETSGGQSVAAVGFPGLLDDTDALFNQQGLTRRRQGEFQINPSVQGTHTPVVFVGTVGREQQNPETSVPCTVITHDAKISEGNSGGALVDRDGRVVGVNTFAGRSEFGIDYAFSVHSRDLIEFARSHGVPILTASSAVRPPGSASSVSWLLWLIVALACAVMFTMLMKRPRVAVADAMSRVVGTVKPRPSRPQTPVANPRTPQPGPTRIEASPPSATAKGFHLRGKDPEGNSYQVQLDINDFKSNGGRVVIGRKGDLCRVVIKNNSVSRQHATLALAHDTLTIEDRNSGNGTLVNSQPLRHGAEPMRLRQGDRITLGDVELVLDIRN